MIDDARCLSLPILKVLDVTIVDVLDFFLMLIGVSRSLSDARGGATAGRQWLVGVQ